MLVVTLQHTYIPIDSMLSISTAHAVNSPHTHIHTRTVCLSVQAPHPKGGTIKSPWRGVGGGWSIFEYIFWRLNVYVINNCLNKML